MLFKNSFYMLLMALLEISILTLIYKFVYFWSNGNNKMNRLMEKEVPPCLERVKVACRCRLNRGMPEKIFSCPPNLFWPQTWGESMGLVGERRVVSAPHSLPADAESRTARYTHTTYLHHLLLVSHRTPALNILCYLEQRRSAANRPSSWTAPLPIPLGRSPSAHQKCDARIVVPCGSCGFSSGRLGGKARRRKRSLPTPLVTWFCSLLFFG